MSRAWVEYALNLAPARVSTKARHLLLVLSFHKQEQRITYWPSHQTLAREMGLAGENLSSLRQIRHLVAELRQARVLGGKPGVGSGKLSSYVLLEVAEKQDRGSLFQSEKQDTKQDKGDGANKVLQNPLQEQNLTPKGALRDWFEMKDILQEEFPEAEWVRAMYLFRTFGDALGLTLPPNGEMIARAKSCSRLQELARQYGYSGALISSYPTAYEVERMRVDFPDYYAALPDALKRKYARKPVQAAG